MSFGGWVVFCTLVPALCVGGWWTVYRIWRQDVDITEGPAVQILPTRSTAGANAARLPMVMCMTSAWLGILALELLPTSGKVRDVVTWVFFVAIMGSGLLVPWMIAFAWPRFLVPPAFRGQPGWLLSAARDLRHLRQRHRH